MKKLLLILWLSLIVTDSKAQKLIRDEVDEFTNESVKSTSFDVLCANMKFMAQVAITEINGKKLLEVKLSTGQYIPSISEGEELMLKLQNGEVVTLISNQFVQACKGCAAKGLMGSGADGIHAFYRIEEPQELKLKQHAITKIRIYTYKGYMEGNIKEGKSELLKNQLALF